MARVINSGQTDTLVVQNKSIKAIDLTTFAKSSTNNQYAVVNHKGSTIRATLYRDGAATTILSGNVWALTKSGYFFDGSFDFDETPSTGSSHIIAVAKSSSVKGEYWTPMMIPLGGIINIKGNDRLEIELQCDFAGTYCDTAASYVNLDVTECVGLEFVTPVTRAFALQAGQSELTKSLGNNVTNIIGVTSESNSLTANQIFTNVQVTSDKVKTTYNYGQLIAQRAAQFEGNFERDHSFCFYTGGNELDNCNLDLQLDASNISAGQVYVVAQSYHVKRATIAKARRRAQKHARKRTAKLG